MVEHMKKPPRRRWPVVCGAFLVVVLAAGLYWFQPWRLWTNTVVDDALPVLAADISSQAPTVLLPSQTATVEISAVQTSAVDISAVQTSASASALASRSRVVGTSSAVSTATPTTSAATTPTSSAAATPTSSAPATPTTSAPTATSTRATVKTPSASTAAPISQAAPKAALLATGTLITHEHATSGTVRIVRLADGSRVLTLENLRTSDGPALHVWLTDAPVIEGEDGWKVFDDGRYADLGDLKGNIGNQVYAIPDDLDLSKYSSVSIWCERFSVSFGAAELDAT